LKLARAGGMVGEADQAETGGDSRQADSRGDRCYEVRLIRRLG